MIVRLATPDDMAVVENMAEAAHAEAPRYAQFPYDRAKAAVFGQLCLTHPDFMLLIAEKDGTIVGFLAAAVMAYYFSSARYGCSIAFVVSPEYRGTRAALLLARDFEQQCMARGAVEVLLGSSTGAHADKVERLGKALGYTNLGQLMVKNCHVTNLP